jgi:hypothetical protein
VSYTDSDGDGEEQTGQMPESEDEDFFSDEDNLKDVQNSEVNLSGSD